MDIASLYQIYLSTTGVSTDTRQIAAGNLFFALKGDKFNANLFANDALLQGASFAVVDEPVEETEQNRGRIIMVGDVLKALQHLAALHRKQLKCPVLAITGSNGKTTTKELVKAVLSCGFKTHATAGNLNNHIGVPFTLLRTPATTEFLIIEMGANHQHEIESYCQYTAPDYGLITNIGKAHLEGFGGPEGVLKGKTELYAYIGRNGGKIFVSSESKDLTGKSAEFIAPGDIIYYGRAENDYCRGECRMGEEFLTVELEDGSLIHTQLVGAYNFENVMAAVCVGRYFGIDADKIIPAIESYQPSNNRSQKLISGNNTIILDAYNANPSSMEEALKNFAAIDAPRKIVILGEMMELGDYSKAEHEKIYALTSSMPLLQRVFIGEGFRMLKGLDGLLYFSNAAELKEWYHSCNFDHCTILIKGSRKNALEKILEP